VEEKSYRQSRLCRVFGNPIAFSIVELLLENREMSPSQLARRIGRAFIGDGTFFKSLSQALYSHRNPRVTVLPSSQRNKIPTESRPLI
jgi:hypothetical protein